MLKQDELDQLRQYNFDLAITEMIDFCGVSLMRYIGIKNHIWLSTTPIHDVVLHSLGRYMAFSSIKIDKNKISTPEIETCQFKMDFGATCYYTVGDDPFLAAGELQS